MERRGFWGKSPVDKELEKLAKAKKNIPTQVVTFGGFFYSYELEKIYEFLKIYKNDSFYIHRHGTAILAHRLDKITFIIKF